MRLRISELSEPQAIEISGNEPWLRSIYESFAKLAEDAATAPNCRKSPLITGQLRATPIASEPSIIVHITGSVNYTPDLPCSRCSDLIPWAISASVDVYYEPPEDLPDEKPGRHMEITLREDDLGRYHYTNDQIDIEALLNDTIQTHVPSQTIARDTERDNCLVCGKDLSSELVFGENRRDESPFSILNRPSSG
jgi:uncharacterized metal-binding protein YceD (DUF177 family)